MIRTMAACVYPPGDFLRDEMLCRGWRRTDTAERMGWTIAELVRVIRGRDEITPQIAERLSAVLGTSADFWLNLQAAHNGWRRERAR